MKIKTLFLFAFTFIANLITNAQSTKAPVKDNRSSVLEVQPDLVPSYLPADSIVAWYPFNGNANDLSGNGNNGFTVSATLNNDRFNNANTAYELNVAGSGITLLNGGAWLQNNRTVSFWFKSSVNPNVQRIVGYRPTCAGGNTEEWFEFDLMPNTDSISYGNPDVNIFPDHSANSTKGKYSLNQWTNIIMVKKNGLAYLYINGVLAAMPITANPITQSSQLTVSSQNSCIANYGLINQRFIGLTDDIAVWQRALSQDEIKQVYNSGAVTVTVQQGTTICAGTRVNFTATLNNINGSVAYQWKKNGITTGTNSSLYTDSTLNNNDTVYCEVSINNVTYQSNKPVIKVNALPRATISASGPTTNLCPGVTVTLKAFASPTYLWSNGLISQTILVNTAGAYTVTVTNTSGCSATSAPKKVTYLKCGKPAGLAVSGITNTSATLSWTAVPCAVQYQLQYRKVGVTAWTTVNVISASSAVLTGLLPATAYQWRILTVCNGSQSAYSNGPGFTTAASINTSGAGIDLNAGNILFNATVFPNPANSKAVLLISGNQHGTIITITDVAGKILWKSVNVKDAQVNLPVEKLTAGLYIVTVTDGHATKIVKLVKE
ncbi:MAG: LamG-like jellyroll fold domain-containing protein [Panacibacter sp.]